MLARRSLIGWLLVASGVVLGGCDSCSKPASETQDAGGTAAKGSDASTQAPHDASEPVNELTLSSEAVTAAVNPSKLPVYEGTTGSVEGTITVTGDLAPTVQADFSKCPEAAKVWGHAFREGALLADGKSRPLADAVIVVTGYAGFVPETKPAATLTIEGCGFTQRTIALTLGQRIDVVNRSPGYWTPYLEPGPKQVMRMATPHGDPVALYPKKPGRFAVLDYDRSYASADTYVFLHPLHATTDLVGHYRIDGIPTGKVQIGVVHPQFSSPATSDVQIDTNVVHKVDLSLTFDAKAWAETNAPKPVPRIH